MNDTPEPPGDRPPRPSDLLGEAYNALSREPARQRRRGGRVEPAGDRPSAAGEAEPGPADRPAGDGGFDLARDAEMQPEGADDAAEARTIPAAPSVAAARLADQLAAVAAAEAAAFARLTPGEQAAIRAMDAEDLGAFAADLLEADPDLAPDGVAGERSRLASGAQDEPPTSESMADPLNEPAAAEGLEQPHATGYASPSVEAEAEEGLQAVHPGAAREEDVDLSPALQLEALLFASDAPQPAARLAEALELSRSRDVDGLVAGLNRQYQASRRSFRVELLAGGYQMLTLPAYDAVIGRLRASRAEQRLSPSAMETLAVIAYRQPVTRVAVESIRGVACGEMIRTLMERGLVKITGRAEELGRPLLYGTTKRFLRLFGLASLRDLPQTAQIPLAGPGGDDAPATAPAGDGPMQPPAD